MAMAHQARTHIRTYLSEIGTAALQLRVKQIQHGLGLLNSPGQAPMHILAVLIQEQNGKLRPFGQMLHLLQVGAQQQRLHNKCRDVVFWAMARG